MAMLARTTPGAATKPPRPVFLHAGQLIESADPCRVTTILGSCVAVGVWDVWSGVGGINHYMLPLAAAQRSGSARFGSVALPLLLTRLTALGARQGGLRAKVFGGACVLEAMRESALGGKNVELARRFLAERGIPIVAEDVGGDRGRKLVFTTGDGAAEVRFLTGNDLGTD